MKRLIKRFPDGTDLSFDTGAFDDWCVMLTNTEKKDYPPRDTEYFSDLVRYGSKYGNIEIYKDFLWIFDRTTKTVSRSVLTGISGLAKKYPEDEQSIDTTLTILYAGMVAEENKAFAKLGKRIKRLGVFQVLIEGIAPEIAAHFSRKRSWRELSTICSSKGF